VSQHQALRRVPVQQQVAQQLRTVTLPAPTRGLIQSENEAFIQPGAAIVCDNWVPTLRGVKLRGGYLPWCTLPEPEPIISGFEYTSGGNQRIYVANATKLYDVSSTIPTLVKDGQTSGNYSATEFSNAAGDWIIVVNDNGDAPLRSPNGIVWETVTVPDPMPDPPPDPPPITGPPGSTVEEGRGLTYVWKYRNRLFFIEGGSMNAWYLGINSIGGALLQIPLSGATSVGGRLLFGGVLSMDAGDGMDDKCVFVTDRGEAIIFTGSNPGDPANWRQEGRYFVGEPLGMNAHCAVGGDLLIMTVEGIVPLAAAIQKTGGQLELAMVTRNIKPMWRNEVIDRREFPWTITRWDEYGGIFVAMPGGEPGQRRCLVANSATGAWARFTNYDAQCFLKMNNRLYFGTQEGVVMEAERGGSDNGFPYLATLVGGWEMFQQPSSMVVWHQARAVFVSNTNFIPQISATTNFEVVIPPAPPVIPDTGELFEVWDQGKWDAARWDQDSSSRNVPFRNTMWVSVGATGFTHAPIVQVTVAQPSHPSVELIAIAATYERAGVNV
jgi:hypothetical protein